MKLESLLHLGGSYQEVYPYGESLFTCSGGAIQRINTDLTVRWSSPPIGAHWIAIIDDLDADGHDEILTSNGRHVFILSADDGSVLWSYDVGPPFSYGTYATMFQCAKIIPNARGKQFTVPCFSHKEVLLFDCSDGARNTKLLHALWMNDAYHPTTVVGDVNGDGKPEIVIARLGGVYVFDPSSGAMLSSTQWESDEERRRNYGHFELVDIDNDGELEAIIISDRVTRHIAVLDNDGKGNFSPLWDRFIEHIYPNDSTELRYTYGSVFAIAGKSFIATSAYNSYVPGKWCTELTNPITGEAITRIEDQWLAGVIGERVLLQASPSRAIPQFSELSIATIESDGTLSHSTSLGKGQFAKQTKHYRNHKGQFKPEVFGADTVWCSRWGNPLLIQQSDDRYQLAEHSSGRQILFEHDKPFRIAAAPDNTLIVSTVSGQLIDAKSSLQLQLGYHLTTEAHISARPGIEATVWNDVIIAPTFSNRVIRSKPGNELYLKGRGRLGYDGVYHNLPVFRDKFVLVTDEGLSHAQLTIYNLSGEVLDRIDLPSYPSSRLGSRIGIYDWQFFEHSQGPALYLAAYRSPSMNSECSLALLLETKEILWEITNAGEGEFGRGIGPWGSSALTTINGSQTVIFCAKDTLVTLDLETGEFVRPPQLLTDLTKQKMIELGSFKEQGFDTWSTIDDPFTAYGTVIPYDINDDGLDEYVIAGCFGGFGILNHNFSTLWWKVSHFGDVLYRIPALTRMGDNELKLIQSHADSIRAYSVYTGALLHSLELEGIATNITESKDAGLIVTTNYGKIYSLDWKDRKFVVNEIVSTDAALGSPQVSNGHITIASASGTLYSLKNT